MAPVDVMGVFAQQRRFKSTAQARDFFFRAIAKILGLKPRAFKQKGLGLFTRPTTIHVNVKKIGGDIDLLTIERGLKELLRVTRNPNIIRRLLRLAYQSTIIPAVRSRYSMIGSRTDHGKSTFNDIVGKVRTRILDQKIEIKDSGAGTNISLGTFQSWIKTTEFLDKSTSSAFNNIWMILEFGSGPKAIFPRPFKSIKVTPHKVPEFLGAEVGQWISGVIKTKKGITRFAIPGGEKRKGITILEAMHQRIAKEKTIQKRIDKGSKDPLKGIKFAKVPFATFASRGHDPAGAFFKRSGVPREYRQAKTKFREELLRLINERVRKKVPNWPVTLLSGSQAAKTPFASIDISVTG